MRSGSVKKKWLACSIVLLGIFSINACGVKGDPLPPLQPAEMSKGKSSYDFSADQRPDQKAQQKSKQDASDEDDGP